MRSWLRLLVLGVLGLLVMAGCASAPSSSAPIEAASDDGKITPGEGLSQDVSLVANSGRPQFLDSYAVW